MVGQNSHPGLPGLAMPLLHNYLHCFFVGEASRQCSENGQWENDTEINVTQCTNMELMSLNDQAEVVLNTFESNNITVFAISRVQAISENLTTLTNTSDRPLVPNDINTTNNVLTSLIRSVHTVHFMLIYFYEVVRVKFWTISSI